MGLDRRRIAPGVLAVLALATAVVASRAGANATHASAVTKTVMLVGDSVPNAFAAEFAEAAAERGYVVVNAAAA